tara:strand:+ start:2751 stop:2960 length:210 start_codon:yes stop_codon:yes gene_type:complete
MGIMIMKKGFLLLMGWREPCLIWVVRRVARGMRAFIIGRPVIGQALKIVDHILKKEPDFLEEVDIVPFH